MAEANQMIGRYHLLQRLGAGGLGEVERRLRSQPEEDRAGSVRASEPASGKC